MGNCTPTRNRSFSIEAPPSDAYVKLSLLTMIMRRDLRLDPTHPALEALRGITEALDNVHIKVSPSALPEEGERH